MQVRRTGALAALCLGFAAPAMADPPAVQNVPWVSAPTVADLVAAFPAGARCQRIAGSVSLGCVIGRDGRVRFCDVITEAPRFKGFANAALWRPWSRDRPRSATPPGPLSRATGRRGPGIPGPRPMQG